MSALSSWQKIDRVLLGQPFGDGKDGAYSSATIPTLVYKTCTGTAASTTLTASTSSPFTVGDVLLIHQSRGTSVGQWEVNRVTVVGSDQYTLQTALQYTYVSPAQAIKIPRYTNVTVESGTWTILSWNQSLYGILAFACKGIFTQTGSITGNGADASSYVAGTGKGYKGGNGWDLSSNMADQGEGTVGVGADNNRNANGNGGGAGLANGNGAGGGGGGSNVMGTNGANGGYGSDIGLGGVVGIEAGSSDLVNAVLGGGGGGGAKGNNTGTNVGGGGGAGGALTLIFAKTVATPTGILSLNGGAGVTATYTADHRITGGGGGGAGGSCLIVCQTATLGTNKFTTTAGSGGAGTADGGGGGTGGVGRIAVHHSGPVTGTTSPSFTDVSDASLRESASMGYMI